MFGKILFSFFQEYVSSMASLLRCIILTSISVKERNYWYNFTNFILNEFVPHNIQFLLKIKTLILIVNANNMSHCYFQF